MFTFALQGTSMFLLARVRDNVGRGHLVEQLDRRPEGAHARALDRACARADRRVVRVRVRRHARRLHLPKQREGRRQKQHVLAVGEELVKARCLVDAT